MDQQVLLLP